MIDGTANPATPTSIGSFSELDADRPSANPFFMGEEDSGEGKVPEGGLEGVEDWPGHRYLPPLVNFPISTSGEVPATASPTLANALQSTRSQLEKERAQWQAEYEAENTRINREYKALAWEVKTWGGLRKGYLWVSKLVVGREDEAMKKKQEEGEARLAQLSAQCCGRFYTMRSWVYDKKLYSERVILQELQKAELAGLVDVELAETLSMAKRQNAEREKVEKQAKALRNSWLVWDKEANERKAQQLLAELKERHDTECLELGSNQGLRRERVGEFYSEQLVKLAVFYGQQKDTKIKAGV
eukprot:comp20225_c0_seq1/m.25196 comp20225_c0_seq1/g.25196  ORF comp20225_c0_seq1/g.25196 comp20225_c0_seq1/m.25196 type:complete len:300 (-) comp20225_c0_seq1:346-1245(-)